MGQLLKNFADRILAPLGLEIRTKAREMVSPSILEIALEAAAASGKLLHVVQVGANDGYHGDPLHHFLMSHREYTRALLIEPQPEIIRHLEAAYIEHPHIAIFNGAVGSSDRLVLHRIKPSLWSSFEAPYLRGSPKYRAPSGLTSANRDHVLRAARRYLRPGIDAEEALETIEVPCGRLPELLSLLGFPSQIHLLQVDAEGADDEVIYACDIPALRPNLINFESKLLGGEARTVLEAFLTHNGYRLHWSSASDTLAVLHPAAKRRRAADGLNRGPRAPTQSATVPPADSAATAPRAPSGPGA